jgi:hypothetical protein
MGALAELLNSRVFTVHSPDGQINATVSNRDRVELQFQPHAYRRYDEAALAHQLTRLAAAVWVESERRYRAAVGEATGESFREERLVRGSMRRRYYQDLAELEVEGWSSSGWVGIWTLGLLHWNVVIAPGAIRSLKENEFAAEAAEAARSLLASHSMQVHRLKDEHFDLRLPDGSPVTGM